MPQGPDMSSVIAHYSAIEGPDDQTYPNSPELLSVSASFSQHFGLMRLGIHHERLKPGRRVSWPHAEADEEEFVYVIEGTPDVWLDGHLTRLKPGDGVGFPAGTGLAHTVINNTEEDVRILVVGEASRYRSRIHYPMHPARNAEIGERHWKDMPARPLGPHDGLPDKAQKP
ncbi:MAG: cupin domain-containing protein [Aestuariivirga sp.]